MVVRRKSGQQLQYYHCSRHYRSWSVDRCTYRSFVPGSWDDTIWDCVYALLMQDAWVEEHLRAGDNQAETMGKLIKSEQQKILQAQTKITKIREGFEGEIHSLDEARTRIADRQDIIAKAEQEIKRIREQMDSSSHAAINGDTLRQELEKLAQKNLEEATFEEKRDIINKLDIRVYPSEDLKTMRVKCGLNVEVENDSGGVADTNGCGIVMFGLPLRTKGRTPTTSFSDFAGGIGKV